MIEQDKYCVDVLTQLSSVIAACEKVGLIILEDHIKGCLRDAIVQGNSEASVQELVDVVGRFIRSGGTAKTRFLINLPPSLASEKGTE